MTNTYFAWLLGARSYPALLETSDGLLHIVFSYRKKAIKHVIVDEAWIMAGPVSKGIFKGHSSPGLSLSKNVSTPANGMVEVGSVDE